jgi:hypothetical protein
MSNIKTALSELNAERNALELTIIELCEQFKEKTGVEVTGITATSEMTTGEGMGGKPYYNLGELEIFVELAWWAQ